MASFRQRIGYFSGVTEDITALYNALSSHDPRFDGVFYVGVTSTGIYCRPVCTAKTPRAENCRFFNSAELAEKSGFRPCLRCRPELAPGNAPVDDSRRIAALVAQRIDEGMVDEGGGIEAIAKKFGWSTRQIRRMVQSELGVSPIELVLTRRLLLAKQLLTETTLPITEVAFASGFSSLRRFNDAFNGRYRMAPTRFRKSLAESSAPRSSADSLTLQLSYRPPFDWKGILAFLRARATESVEVVTSDTYLRSVRLGDVTGWVSVSNVPGKRTLLAEMPYALTPVLPALLGRLRHLFDLSARPELISTHLGKQEILRKAVRRNPGLRVPGAFDGFEIASRAILGQQISVKAATTLAGRFAEAFGDEIETPHAELMRLSPTAKKIASVTAGDVASLGIVRTRAESIVALAREIASGRLSLEPGSYNDGTIAQLVALPGVGEWTANYIAMRALRWPDAFLSGDAIVRKRLGGISAASAESVSEPWRPWRSYATLHLWQMEP
jgi:AraC family transcriptional regulator of adaptative response / DNA-3-methyladenine glycosylase II